MTITAGEYLTDAQVASYHDSGFFLVKNLLSRDEAEFYRTELHDLAGRMASSRSADPTWQSAREQAGMATALQGGHNVQFCSAAFTRLLADDRLTGVTAALMGTQNVQLHHNKFFIKPPERGSNFPMHQDYPFFPHTTHSVLAVILHMDDAPQQKGCVHVVPGSHRLGPLPHIEDADGGFHLAPGDFPASPAVPVEAEAGDALFFSYLTVHGSGVNTSSEARTTLLVQMRDPQDKPATSVHLSPGQGMMLRGIDSGLSG